MGPQIIVIRLYPSLSMVTLFTTMVTWGSAHVSRFDGPVVGDRMRPNQASCLFFIASLSRTTWLRKAWGSLGLVLQVLGPGQGQAHRCSHQLGNGQ